MLSVKRRMGSVKQAGGSELWGTASLKGWQASFSIRLIQCECRSLRSWESLSLGLFRRCRAWRALSTGNLRRLYNSLDAEQEVKV
jgi:hypothetical protein